MSSETPNILIFMTDHGQGAVFRPDHPAITPNADRLVREGLSFSDTYCPAAHCCPSRATFMTGLFPSRHGVYNNVSNSSAIHRELTDGVATFGEHLAAAGYRMRYCGKWHVSDTKGPQDYGWEERAVTSNRGASKARSEDQWWRGGDEGAGDLTNRRPGEILRPGWGYYRLYGAWEDDAERRGRSHPDEAVVDAALESLGDFATGQGPWCLFVGPIGPHDPYIVPRRYRDLYDLDKVELPPSYSDVLTDKPNIYRRMREQLWDQLSKEEACDAVRHYWAYCTYEDELLGRLLDELDRRGWSDNTLVLLVSDHGDYVGAHGLFLKGVPAFREAYHVPAVVRWPAGIPQVGREISALVSLADFFPTFVELATGRPVTESLSGASLVPFLQGGPPERWREALLTQFNGVELYYSQRSLITTRWKFVYNGFDFDELYSRVDDPYETNNLARHGGYDDVVRELLEQMWRSAEREEDWLVFNRYPTVAFAAQGPMGQDYSGER